ncbi:hypothetical protein AX769_05815 [Frondihabitans sp. PAMC 28766]|uniref:AAA family ATPase n=1 Tax=Frondihabitans sp. PAMC 28766 TaxID=1795630 RepID=UPI00078B2888|nr:ATP-binding protein [Frondihabitans sp. PAMC 28766]AMM19754.1 hypothetical protein AX769_05815 [Frondihabitans sp. PAMC 28766]
MALTLMCGLSFAGKSTLAARLAEKLDASLISLDAINEERGLYGGQGIPLEEWAASDEIAHERVETLLREGRQVVVDDTGSPRFIRDQWRASASAAKTDFALVWVQIDLALQRERVNANRELQQRHDVTDAVLKEHAGSFESPTDESALVIDAQDTRDPQRIDQLLAKIRRGPVR